MLTKCLHLNITRFFFHSQVFLKQVHSVWLFSPRFQEYIPTIFKCQALLLLFFLLKSKYMAINDEYSWLFSSQLISSFQENSLCEKIKCSLWMKKKSKWNGTRKKMFEMNTLQSDLNEMVSVCCLRRERIQVLTFSLDENIYTSKVSNRKGFFHLNPRIQNK